MAEGRWTRDALPAALQRKTTAATRFEMRQRYEAGETIAELAAAFGLSGRTVGRTLRDMGVQMRPPCRRFGPLRTTPQDQRPPGFTPKNGEHPE